MESETSFLMMTIGKCYAEFANKNFDVARRMVLKILDESQQDPQQLLAILIPDMTMRMVATTLLTGDARQTPTAAATTW